MTIGEWLASRTPVPPPELLARLTTALGPALERDRAELWSACLGAAERMLVELLEGGCAGRERALDLLAVDALVTYAFEAACDDPGRLDARAQEAMTRVAALATHARS